MRWGWIAFAGICMAVSGSLLLIAQKTIPMGTAYAVWTDIGAVGTFVLGLLLFSEPATPARFFFVGRHSCGANCFDVPLIVSFS
jgi:quaternary ammonium compound-resistance protein SugE